MNEIAKAERVSHQRAIIFYLLSGVLILALVVTGPERQPARLLPWLTTIILGAVNLVSVGLTRSRKLTALLNDESTREHRAMAFTCGFWAALASGVATSITATMVSVPAILIARVIVTATLIAALVAFATLELRAARG